MASGVSAFDGNPYPRSSVASVPASVLADPRPPKITWYDLLCQFRKDITGKEVDIASTYSYTWTAVQIGHVCVGIVFNFILTEVARYALPIGIHATRHGIAGIDASWH